MMSRRAAIALAGAVVAVARIGPALAHGDGAEGVSDQAWRIAVAVPLLFAGGAYLWGLRRLWRRAGRGRGVSQAQALAFCAGFAVLALMLALPLHAWGRLRFAPHMAEHELLTVVAAPLLAAGRPAAPYLLALPSSWRHRVARWIIHGRPRRLWRALVRPVVAWAPHGTALWLWHVPALFEAALRSGTIHYLQHVSLLATALLFWASILPRRADTRTRMVGAFSLFTTSMHMTLLGALLTLSPTVWYASYATLPEPAGMSALEDQQIAGLIMWVPAGLIYVAAALALCTAVLRDDGRAPQIGAIGGQSAASGGFSR